MRTHTLRYAPFDAHVHVRDQGSAMFNAVLPYTAKQCKGAVIMPNTNPFITTPELADEYASAICSRAPGFRPIMTGYLTAETKVDDVVRGFQRRSWHAMKFYPKGATTNSHGGLESPLIVPHVLETMEKIGMPLLIHPECNVWNEKETDPYDREKIFLIEILDKKLRKRFPELKISLEHVTTEEATFYIDAMGGKNLVCTVTAHHLLASRQDFFRNGVNPHLHCWPVLKREKDRQALLRMVKNPGNCIFAGTDSAPHPTTAKERACGCAGGVFTAHAMIELYAEAFDSVGAMDQLDAFLGINGPRFYGLEPLERETTLTQENWTVDYMIEVDEKVRVRPFGYHENPNERNQLHWRVS